MKQQSDCPRKLPESSSNIGSCIQASPSRRQLRGPLTFMYKLLYISFPSNRFSHQCLSLCADAPVLLRLLPISKQGHSEICAIHYDEKVVREKRARTLIKWTFLLFQAILSALPTFLSSVCVSVWSSDAGQRQSGLMNRIEPKPR